MPFHWARIPTSPPKQRRDEVAGICRDHGARLVDNQTFYDEQGNAHALIDLKNLNEEQIQALLDALGALEWAGQVDADEEQDGKRPPPSGRRP